MCSLILDYLALTALAAWLTAPAAIKRGSERYNDRPH